MKKPKKKKKPGTALAVRKPTTPAVPRTPLQVIVDAARDRSVDPGKLRELIAMQRDLEAQKALVEFGLAMREAKGRIPVVVKDATNEEIKTKYPRLETVSRVVDPIIREAGFTLSYGMAESNLPGHYRVTCRVRHDGGHVENHFIDLPADDKGPKGGQNKTLVHGVASSITYARRILKILIFDVNVANQALPDDDGNMAGGMAGTVTPAVAQQIINACDAAGLDKSKFCDVFQIDGIALLPASRAREALDRIEQFSRAKAAA